ncbi:MAG: hypothetical protein IKN54_04060 [Lachnospiraceae bacterium]|nr:hypothetical protein [Lachnospiraceae bacterium]
MRWYDKLYVGEKADKKRKEIIEKVTNGMFQLDKFVLALPFNDSDVLDIYPSNILVQSHYLNSDIYILGIADGMDEAKEVMQKIILDCYNQTGQFDLKGYIR